MPPDRHRPRTAEIVRSGGIAGLTTQRVVDLAPPGAAEDAAFDELEDELRRVVASRSAPVGAPDGFQYDVSVAHGATKASYSVGADELSDQSRQLLDDLLRRDPG
jgi:hypothetical protein